MTKDLKSKMRIAYSKSGVTRTLVIALVIIIIVGSSVSAYAILRAPSSSPSPTPTPTPTTTATSSPSPSPSPTSSETATPNPTSTATQAPTTTPYPNPSHTASSTPTATPSPTPTPTPTPPQNIGDNTYAINTWQTVSFTDFNSGIYFNFSQAITGDFYVTIDVSNMVEPSGNAVATYMNLYNQSIRTNGNSLNGTYVPFYGYEDWLNNNSTNSAFTWSDTSGVGSGYNFINQDNSNIVTLSRTENLMTYGYTSNDNYIDNVMQPISATFIVNDGILAISGSIRFMVSTTPP